MEVKTVQISEERYWEAKRASAIQKKSLKLFLEDAIAEAVKATDSSFGSLAEKEIEEELQSVGDPR
ncbi:MAG: hypothetical protein PHV74_13910 [Dehalococcoidia bacterium]|nr:hypothetical protein [Dehalococcoidia bacterium]